ncbi:MAG: hypothetical protein N2444_07490, partial [Methylocystis sp.]|nr:hypothetical protein [Methylocystis sp.]
SRWADEMKTAPARAPGLLLALSIVGEDGARMFDDNAVEQLASLPAVAVRPVLDAILAHNGLDSAAREAAKGN